MKQMLACIDLNREKKEVIFSVRGASQKPLVARDHTRYYYYIIVQCGNVYCF